MASLSTSVRELQGVKFESRVRENVYHEAFIRAVKDGR